MYVYKGASPIPNKVLAALALDVMQQKKMIIKRSHFDVVNANHKLVMFVKGHSRKKEKKNRKEKLPSFYSYSSHGAMVLQTLLLFTLGSDETLLDID